MEPQLNVFFIHSESLIVLYAALLWTVLDADDGKTVKIRGVGLLLVGLALGAGLYGSAQQTTAITSGVVILLLYVVLVIPISLTGLGLVIGSLTMRFLPRGPWRWMVMIIAFALPLCVVFTAKTDADRRQTERIALAEKRLDAFQQTDVLGSLGGYAIILPVTPLVATNFECTRPNSGGKYTCRTHFRYNNGLRLQANLPAVFQEITVEERAETCRPRCVQFDKLASWCAIRPDWQESIWCEETPAVLVRFSLTSSRHNYERWTKINTGTDEVVLYCREAWKETHCQALFELAPEIQGRAWFVTPAFASPAQAIKMREYGERLWRAMTDV